MDSDGTVNNCYHYQLLSVIDALGPSVVFGCKGILLNFGIFLTYETQSVTLKQVNDSRFVGLSIYNVVARNQKQAVSRQPSKERAWCTRISPVRHCYHYQLLSVIDALSPSVEFGCKGILLNFGIFLTYETQSRDGQMVKSLIDSLVSGEEEERQERNLNEDEQLKKQTAESISSGASLEQPNRGQLIQLKKLVPTVTAGEAISTCQTVVLDTDAQRVRRNFMERSICGSSLVGTRTTDKRSKDYRHICTMDQLEKSLECHFSKESIILHQEPSMTEVGITIQQWIGCSTRLTPVSSHHRLPE
ncbi:hypothetical protein RRG08_004282 [Elysia crispata]|uniref:Uncharacterized protein n=1 Tax=Elysia crispata TaxID=231223 RepID=A0AAE0YBV7_9GAST|nr:hypothetical protein RRG08_004282 [Elysia crispata]